MKKYDKLVKNAAGRMVPTIINGENHIPFQGVGKYNPTGRRYGPKIPTCNDFPDGNKEVSTLKEALINAGIKDGMTISSHHHFRNGDLIAKQVFDIAHDLGIKNLRWFPSASFPCQEELIKYLEDGTINRIEGSMNGPLGKFTSEGKMKGLSILRSHGGRYQAVQDGEVKIDIAIIAAPTADTFGNANGVNGDAACGLLGFALADSQYAEKVIVVTDNLVPFPCIPWQIQGNYVDFVVKVDKVGLPEKIISGTTQITKSPDRLLIAEITADFCEKTGLIYDGFSYQAGAGGTALSIGNYFGDILRKNNWKARFIRAGSNQYPVELLEEGLVEYILDGQTFDLEGVRSMRENPNHVNTSPFTSYNFHSKGNFAQLVDIVVLGATEIDVDFNANVVTHSDGYLLHGIGGWQNCLAAKTTIMPIPLFRDRIPVIRDRVTTLCAPGELIDVIVTERGIAINPLRKDLIQKARVSGIELKTIYQLKEEAEKICGVPEEVKLSDEIVSVIKWVDGTVIDSVKKVITE
ncbi:MAG: citrate lyase subunit alpha [Lentimicrobiaceae bacterium]|jgi:citrate lyase subunit alpha/citrate CoA-transferase|nr:citrate lyase subunit alpha [Lentimicrobiaceae bacterium]MBT3455036.1 citrate lyase subunit alpha [Lentimicrobiaceae bacterium]MBT3818679.1 citrate lyase subunit alpha [Lentimicrobiaceae bacterium]MBT4191624.1 citrate lyase subunit alpha [Lentimicrobiaceae bacterium]MBT4467678.1 citrate lyase subunit alpha [Lentimicrobiaceae bacterium]